MSHGSLAGHYKLLFSMCQHHGWSMRDLEDMLPYELDIYADMLVTWLKEKEEE